MPEQGAPKDADLQLQEEIRELLHGHYPPAANAGEAEEFMSTEQVHAIIEEHAPEMVPRFLLRDHLIALGYTTTSIGGVMYWMLRRP